MLNSLNLSGFKSFLENEIVFKNLTVLTGLNSSGKSSILQALLIFQNAYKNHSDILLEDHGSLKDIKNSYQKENIVLTVTDNKEHTAQLELLDDLDEGNNFKIDKDGLEFPEIIYISANRVGPRNTVPIYSNLSLANKIGKNGENLFQFIRSYESCTIDSAIIHPNSEGNTVEFNIRGWLSVISPNVKFTYNIDDVSDTSYGMFNNYRSTNVGFGLSYSLSVIAALLVSTLIPNSLLIIENPEAHLHPKGQSEIARLIALCSNLGTQIIIETHSDHIFDSIRVACKEITEFHEKVQIHWFELNEYGNTKIISPNINSYGRLDEWPQGLFDQFEVNASKLL